ncbi:MAG: stress response translation initiation inhibitor YciH, partial [Candidatus Nitrosotenuis sp.]|jgi:translation initiation factor 1
MIEGLDSKLNDLNGTLSELKRKYACGGTTKDNYIFLQGDHRDTMKETLVRLGFSESSIEVH